MLGHYVAEQANAFSVRSDVASQTQHLDIPASSDLDTLSERLRLLLVHLTVDGHDFRSVFSEEMGGRVPDPSRRTGADDHADLIPQKHRRSPTC
jgi:hypothetical protein